MSGYYRRTHPSSGSYRHPQEQSQYSRSGQYQQSTDHLYQQYPNQYNQRRHHNHNESPRRRYSDDRPHSLNNGNSRHSYYGTNNSHSDAYSNNKPDVSNQKGLSQSRYSSTGAHTPSASTSASAQKPILAQSALLLQQRPPSVLKYNTVTSRSKFHYFDPIKGEFSNKDKMVSWKTTDKEFSETGYYVVKELQDGQFKFKVKHRHPEMKASDPRRENGTILNGKNGKSQKMQKIIGFTASHIL